MSWARDVCAVHVGSLHWGASRRRALSVCCCGLAPSACTDLVHTVMWRGFPTGWLQGQVLNGSRSTRVCRQLGLQARAACRRRTDVAQTGAGSEDTFLSLHLSLSLRLLSSPLLRPSLSSTTHAPLGLHPVSWSQGLLSSLSSLLRSLYSQSCGEPCWLRSSDFSTGLQYPLWGSSGSIPTPDSPSSVLFSVSPLSSPNIFIPSRLSLLHRLGTQRSVPPPLSSELECNPRSCSQLHVASHSRSRSRRKKVTWGSQ